MESSENIYLSILFPAHDEESRLPETLSKVSDFIARQGYLCEVVIIENASTDATLKIAEEYAAAHEHVIIIHDDLPGKGRAVQKGMAAAHGKYRFICDVDLSMPITEIVHFIPPELDDFDIAIASRECKGAVRYGEPYYRHFVGRVFNALVRWMALPELNDTQCGFKCFTAAAADELFKKMTIFGWTFDVEILAIARQKKMRVKEIPIPWYYQPRSKIHVMKDSLRMALDLIEIRKNLRKGVYARAD
jgi:dolichyl-phosphate beta-glucosyltransferase